MRTAHPRFLLALASATRSAMVGGVLAIGLVSSGCAGAGGTGVVEYSVSAQTNYERGLRELERKDWIAASKYFAFVRSRFAYSTYAVLAELRLADAEFGAEQFLEAIESYRLFAKLHPTHEMVANGYTRFRVGEAFYRQLPGDMWLLPPSHEKDQSSIEEAAEELTKFVKQYPESPFRPRGEKILAEIKRRVAAHEWYAARYYWNRDKPMGTVLRLRRLLERYRGVGYDVEALWLLGRAYVAAELPARAREPWTELVEQHPQTEQAAAARAELAKLPAAEAPPAPAPAPTPAPAPITPAPSQPSQP